MLVRQRLQYFADGWPGKKLGEETITSLQMVDGDSLIKDFFGRGENNVHITTPTDKSVLLQTKLSHLNLPNWPTVRGTLRARCTALTNFNRSTSDRPAPRYSKKFVVRRASMSL